MIAFPLDQCLDSKRFAMECRAEGLCQVLRFPSVLRNTEDPELLRTLTVSIAQKVLRRFKAGFAEWHRVAWRNSVVEVTSIGVQVWHVESGKLVRNEYLAFDPPGWQERLIAALEENSRRALPAPGDA